MVIDSTGLDSTSTQQQPTTPLPSVAVAVMTVDPAPSATAYPLSGIIVITLELLLCQTTDFSVAFSGYPFQNLQKIFRMGVFLLWLFVFFSQSV